MSTVDLRKTLHQADKILSQAGIAHALIGGFALAAHGILHRATADIDLLADGAKKEEVKKYADLFNEWSEIQKLLGVK